MNVSTILKAYATLIINLKYYLEFPKFDHIKKIVGVKINKTFFKSLYKC